MKSLIVFAALSFIASIGLAQDFDVPKDGAKIYLSENAFEIKSASQTTVDVWIVRSKRAKKAKFDAPKFLGSSALGIVIEQDPENADHYIATINTTGVKNGTYFYTVSSRSRSSQKVTGATISLEVVTAEMVTNLN